MLQNQESKGFLPLLPLDKVMGAWTCSKNDNENFYNLIFINNENFVHYNQWWCGVYFYLAYFWVIQRYGQKLFNL